MLKYSENVKRGNVLTTLTLHIPEEMASQAKAMGVFNEQSILEAFKTFIQQQKAQPKPRQLGGAEGLVSFLAEDFDEPLDDFKEYM